jgi:hypothetical protein
MMMMDGSLCYWPGINRFLYFSGMLLLLIISLLSCQLGASAALSQARNVLLIIGKCWHILRILFPTLFVKITTKTTSWFLA